MIRLGSMVGCAVLVAAATTGLHVAAHADDAAKMPTSFAWYYEYDPKGWRYWSQIDDKTWLEKFDTGPEVRFAVTGIGTVENCRGLLMLRSDDRLLAFVPDEACGEQVAKFQTVGPNGPGGKWANLGAMQRASYVKNDVPLRVPGQ